MSFYFHWRTLVICVPLLLVLGMAAVVSADTWYVDVNASAGGDGTSTSAPFQTIGAAFNSCGIGDTIHVAVGTYPEAIDITSPSLTLLGGWDAGFTAQSNFDADTGLWSAGSTTIDATGTNDNAIALNAQADYVRIEGFRITGANATGGGIDNYAGDHFILKNCEIYGNENPDTAPAGRGAGLSIAVHDEVLVENVLIHANDSSTAAGQGLFVGFADNPAQPVVFRDVVVRDHTGSVSAVYVWNECRALIFENCDFRNNVSNTYGGAVNLVNANEATSQSVTFNSCRFLNNEGNWGGALCLNMWNQATLIDCVFSNNKAATGGGAIAVYHGASGITLERCAFVGNECLGATGSGAAVILQPANDMITNPWMIARNCVFVANKAFRQVVRCDDAVSANPSFFSTPVEITNCTFDRNFSYNAASCVGVLSDQFVVRISNNIFSRSRMINRTAWDASTFRIGSASVDIEFANNMFYDNLAQNGATTVLQDVGISPTAYLAENIPTAYCKDGVNLNFTDPPAFVMDGDGATTGTWESALDDPTNVEVTLTDTDANWAPGALAGLFVMANSESIRSDATAVNTDSRDVALILANTTTELTVVGVQADFLNTGESGLAGKDYKILDLRATKLSKQINAGDNTAGNPGATDFVGNTRIQDGTIDCGAYEADPTLQPPVNAIKIDGGSIGNDANDGLTWDTPKKTIAAALSTAGSDFEVWVKGGTYLTQFNDDIPNNGRVYGGFAGTEYSAVERDARDYEANETTIYWSTAGSNQYALYINAKSNIIFDGFTLKSDGKGMDNWGGNAVSVRDTSSDIRIRNCKLVEASSADSNSLAFLKGGVTMENCTLLGGRKSGVRLVGDNTFIDCLIANCNETGVRVDASTNSSFEGCVFVNNTATNGGGFAVYGDDAAASFDACVFAGNQTIDPSAGARYGSGIWVNDYKASISATDCLFAGNRDFRGAIYFKGDSVLAGSTLDLTNCNFTGNQHNIVIHATGTNPPAVRVDNCIFARNGGIARADDRILRVDGTDASINHCLFVDNAGDSDFYIDGASYNFDTLDAAYYDTTANENFSAAPLFVMDGATSKTGTWSGEANNADDTVTLTDADADWAPGALVGCLILPNAADASDDGSADSMRKMTVVLSNTANSVIVCGQIDDFIDGTGGTLVGVSYVLADMRAAQDSPLVDAGWSGFTGANPGTDDDFTGVTRAKGTAYDIGIYEFDAAAVSAPGITAGETFGLEPGTSDTFAVAEVTDDQANLEDLAVEISNTQGLAVTDVSVTSAGVVSATIDAGSLPDGTLVSGIGLTVTDDDGQYTTATFIVSVAIGNTNPMVTAQNVATTLTQSMVFKGVVIGTTSDEEDADETLDVAITVNETDLIFSNVVVDASGVVTATITVPWNAAVGTVGPITLRVMDSGGLTDSDTFMVPVEDIEPADVQCWSLFD